MRANLVIGDEELAPFLRNPAEAALSERVIALVEQQKQTWPPLRDGYAGLGRVRVKEIGLPYFPVFVQFNPVRLVSSSARVDAKSIKARRCFLCSANLPEVQRGLLYGSHYLLLCNPAPIFPRHLTIAHLHHRVQSIRGNFEVMLRLARDLAPEFTVFYNGPRCGASAPDHLHFQASPRGTLPVEEQWQEVETEPDFHPLKRVVVQKETTQISTLEDDRRRVLVIESDRLDSSAQWFYRVRKLLSALQPSEPEPMMNVLVTYRGKRWTTFVFPRRAHRPACYFAEGKEKLLISPGAVDMAGLLITVREEDFRKVNQSIVEAVYSEVTLDKEAFGRLVDSLLKLV